MFRNRWIRMRSGISRSVSLVMILLLASMPVSLAEPSDSEGAEEVGSKSPMTIMVIDTSYSMRMSKADFTLREILDIHRELAGSSSLTGYIAYNEELSDERPPAANGSANQASMLQSLEGISFTGFSDLPLGLSTGVDRVLAHRAKGHDGEIRLLLLSDGGMDYRGGDAGGAGQARLAEVIDQAKSSAIPIDAIAIHPAGAAERERLQLLAADTGGAYAEAARPGEAATAVRHILAASSKAPSVFLRALPIWIGAAAVVLAGAVAYALTRPAKALSGRLEGLFLRTASGSSPPMKHWLLNHAGRQEPLTLQHLFRQLDVHEPLPEASRIRFIAGRGNRLLVKSSSRCVIMKNGRVMPRDRRIVLNDREQIYITFEDGRTELVLTYRAYRAGRGPKTPSAASLSIPEDTASKPA